MLIYENLGGALKWNLGAAPSQKNTRVLISPKPSGRAAPTVQLWIDLLIQNGVPNPLNAPIGYCGISNLKSI
jgi:hypothetical protein